MNSAGRGGVLASSHRVGIVNFGADHVVVRDNRVLGNDSLGVIILQNFVAASDARIEPNPGFGQVRGNVILGNGRHPDPVRAITPGADVFYDGTGTASAPLGGRDNSP